MGDNLGDFEQLVMLAVMRLDADAYGTSIREELKTRAERDVSPGAIFTTLERLESRGLVTSRYGEPTAERGGRSKRFYKLTADGRRALARALRTVRRMVQGLELKLERP
jgi:PadR family transcriptional regulator PadR